MGNISSHNMIERNISNYNCSICKKSGKLPNIAGRFYIINEQECICNGCNTIYKKEQIYKTDYEIK